MNATNENSKPTAPAVFAFTQEAVTLLNKFHYPAMDCYNLTADIPCHPRGSTVTRKTLEDAGYSVPEARKA